MNASKFTSTGRTDCAPALASRCYWRDQRRAQPPRLLTDVTARAGVKFVHNNGAFGKKYLPETIGSGVILFDIDGDGWSDALFVNSTNWPGRGGSRTTAALYRNNHDGTFTDVTRGSGVDVELYGIGGAAGDFDNDGKTDLYLTALAGNRLFRNLGGGKFTDVTKAAGVAAAAFHRARSGSTTTPTAGWICSWRTTSTERRQGLVLHDRRQEQVVLHAGVA